MNSDISNNNDISGKPSGLKILLGHLGAIFTVSVWGASFIATKELMHGGFTPVEVYTYRFIIAYLLLLVFTFRKIRANNWSDEITFLICGVCCGSLYFITENYALQNTTTANVSLLSSLSPIFTTMLIALIYKVRINGGVIVGSAIAFIGVAFTIFGSDSGFEINPLGDMLALSSAFSWAIYTLLVKRLIPLYNSFFITRKLFFYGVISSLPLLFLQHEPLHITELFKLQNINEVISLLFLACICSTAAYLIWNESMKKLGSVMANNYLYGQSIVTIIVAWIMLNEVPTVWGVVGCALIIGGLIISDKLKLGKS